MSFDELDADVAREERVFAVGFLAAAPARVAENVDVRRPERQARPPLGVAVVLGGVVVELGAAFDADDGAFLVEQLRIPGGRHADRLRENGGDAVVGHAVQALRSNNHRPAGRAAGWRAPSFCNCATFSASDMRRIKSFSRAFNGCDGSRQIGGSLISGTRVAAAEKASANSEALKATTDAPEASFTSIVLNFAAPLLAAKEIVSGPWIESSSCSTVPVMVANFLRAAGGGEDVKILGQRNIAGSHVEHPLARRARQRFRLADDDGVFARAANARW